MGGKNSRSLIIFNPRVFCCQQQLIGSLHCKQQAGLIISAAIYYGIFLNIPFPTCQNWSVRLRSYTADLSLSESLASLQLGTSDMKLLSNIVYCENKGGK